MYRMFLLGILVAQEIVQDYYFPSELSQEFSFSYVDVDGGMVFLTQPDPRSSRYFNLMRLSAEGKILWDKQIIDRIVHARLPLRVEVVDTTIYVFSRADIGDALWVEGYNLEGDLLFSAQPASSKQPFGHKYTFCRSRDRKTLAVLYQIPNTRSLRWGYLILKGGPPQKGEWEASFPPNRTYLEDAVVSNQGNLYLLFVISPSVIIFGRGDLNLRLVKISAEKSISLEISLPSERKKAIHELRLFVDKEENIRLAGSYAKTLNGTTKGLVFMDLPAGAPSPKEPVYIEFPEEVRKKYFSFLKSGQRFLMHSIIPRADGGLLVAGEVFFLQKNWNVVSMYYFGRPWLWFYTDYKYNYLDALLFNLSPKGEIEWYQAIHKKQRGRDPSQFSYVLFAGSNGLYLFYKAREKGQGVGLYAVHVNLQGYTSPKRRIIPALRKRDIFFLRDCRQVSNKEGFLVWWQRKGKILHATRISF